MQMTVNPVRDQMTECISTFYHDIQHPTSNIYSHSHALLVNNGSALFISALIIKAITL